MGVGMNKISVAFELVGPAERPGGLEERRRRVPLRRGPGWRRQDPEAPAHRW